MCKFRLLRAEEIECRPKNVKQDGFSLLLYKDARVDQNILDETVGSLNWQKHYSRDNANCIVSIWDEKKGQWIEKEDTGEESNQDAKKGLASDSFKRACFAWGIGRELYSAPFIWITGEDPHSHFDVTEVGYDENRRIIKLVIVESRSQRIVFSLNGTKAQTSKPKKAEKKTEKVEEKKEPIQMSALVTEEEKAEIIKELDRTSIDAGQILSYCNVESIDKIPHSTFPNLITILRQYPTFEKEEQ